MKKLLIPLLLITSLLAGCAQRQYQPVAQLQKENEFQAIKNSGERVNECADGLRKEVPSFGKKTDPAVLAATNIVDSQILFYTDTSPNKIELMASTAKITPGQKQALLTHLAANQKCRELSRSEFKTFPSFLIVYENYYGDTDIIYSKLISREITIGEANREKSKLLAKSKTDANAAAERLNNQYNSAINQEVQAAQNDAAQRRALATQYLMNQQNINAQQQINNQNQFNNSINRNKPVNTNCTRYGNQVNCTSY